MVRGKNIQGLLDSGNQCGYLVSGLEGAKEEYLKIETKRSGEEARGWFYENGHKNVDLYDLGQCVPDHPP